MPVIISTPEDWFRTKQRDLNIIQYRGPEENNKHHQKEKNNIDSPFMLAQKELNAWFDERLHNTRLRILGPSEYSGWVTGGPSNFTADFDEFGLALFNDSWDENSAWYIEILPIANWQQRIEATQLLSLPAKKKYKRCCGGTRRKAYCY